MKQEGLTAGHPSSEKLLRSLTPTPTSLTTLLYCASFRSLLTSSYSPPELYENVNAAIPKSYVGGKAIPVGVSPSPPISPLVTSLSSFLTSFLSIVWLTWSGVAVVRDDHDAPVFVYPHVLRQDFTQKALAEKDNVPRNHLWSWARET